MSDENSKFFNEMSDMLDEKLDEKKELKLFFDHIRNSERRFEVSRKGGATVAVAPEIGVIAVSACSEKDFFSRSKGRALATARMTDVNESILIVVPVVSEFKVLWNIMRAVQSGLRIMWEYHRRHNGSSRG